MSPPKHLWSGDWERESAAASDALAGHRPDPAEPGAEPSAPAPAHAGRPRRVIRVPRRPRLSRTTTAILGALVVLAAGAVVLSSLLSTSSRAPHRTAALGPSVAPSVPTAPITPTIPTLPVPPPAVGAPGPAAPAVPAHLVRWLGMEIQTLPPGVAVIDTVAAGSPAAQAGLQPGYAILTIDNRAIHGTTDIAPAIRGLHAGDRVTLQLSYGSGFPRAVVTLAGPPSAYP